MTPAEHIEDLLLAAAQAVRSGDYPTAKTAVRQAQRAINRELFLLHGSWHAAFPPAMAPVDGEATGTAFSALFASPTTGK
jgi:hypothetical protein